MNVEAEIKKLGKWGVKKIELSNDSKAVPYLRNYVSSVQGVTTVNLGIADLPYDSKASIYGVEIIVLKK